MRRAEGTVDPAHQPRWSCGRGGGGVEGGIRVPHTVLSVSARTRVVVGQRRRPWPSCEVGPVDAGRPPARAQGGHGRPCGRPPASSRVGGGEGRSPSVTAVSPDDDGGEAPGAEERRGARGRRRAESRADRASGAWVPTIEIPPGAARRAGTPRRCSRHRGRRSGRRSARVNKPRTTSSPVKRQIASRSMPAI